MTQANPVRHNAAEHRYEIEVDRLLAVAEYAERDGRQVFTHTFVPPQLRGRGLAELLVRAALDDSTAAGRKIIPACSYVAKFIERHPQYQALIAD